MGEATDFKLPGESFTGTDSTLGIVERQGVVILRLQIHPYALKISTPLLRLATKTPIKYNHIHGKSLSAHFYVYGCIL